MKWQVGGGLLWGALWGWGSVQLGLPTSHGLWWIGAGVGGFLAGRAVHALATRLGARP